MHMPPLHVSEIARSVSHSSDIRRLQGSVTSTKSQTGHEMWMAGASELIYSMLMMKNDFIAGNINFENPDEETARIHILPETREAHFDMFLSNSFGFGGTNSTLIVRNL